MNTKLQAFEDFLGGTSIDIPLVPFIINLLLAALLAYILSVVYTKYGNSLSNRRMTGKNFMLVTMTTMLIIAIVKSSLALSLGLVGALSIVRFRAAIKEPEELAYLFLTIAVGLGLGANQTLITVTAFFIIVLLIILRKKKIPEFKDHQNLHLVINSQGSGRIQLDQLVDTLNSHCIAINLKRFDESLDALEASFLVEFQDFSKLNEMKKNLQTQDKAIKISLLDNRALGE